MSVKIDHSKKKFMTYEDIENARKRIEGHLFLTPLLHSNNLSELCGCQVYLKTETMQRCKSFKYRGALNKLLQLPKGITVCTTSHGNHAQGVARAARTCEMKSIIFMPLDASPAKIHATENYGGTVILEGTSFEEARKAMDNQLRKHPDWTYVSAYNDVDVAAGIGTLGCEIAEQLPSADTVVISIGGGGLISGVSCALKHSNPKIRIIGVQMSAYPSVYVAFQKFKGREVPEVTRENPTPLADGIAVSSPGSLNLELIHKFVDDIVLVNEDEVAEAVSVLADRAKIIAEGAGACPLAAIMKGKFPMKPEEKVVALVSGGNIDLTMLGRCIERTLFIEGTRITLKVLLPYGTHYLVKLFDILTELNIEVISCSSTPHVNTYANKERYALILDVSDQAVITKLSDMIEEKGWQFSIAQASVQGS